MVSGGASGRACPAGGDSSPPLGPSEATSGVLCPVLGSAVKKRHGTTGESPAEATKMRWDLEDLFYKERL